MSARPPRAARWLLSRTVPAGPAREGLLGDLHERFLDAVRADGERAARRWYWREASGAAARYVTRRLLQHLRRLSRLRVIDSSNRATIMESLRYDLSYAWRLLRRTPGFTVAAALTVALGVGATTAIFSATQAILFEPPPGVQESDRLITAHRISDDGSSFHAFAYPNYLDLRNANTGLSGLAAYSTLPVSLRNVGEPELIYGLLVSGNYFDVVGARPALGRFFLPEEDDALDTHYVAVLSHRAWTRRFGADSSVIGTTVNLNGRTFTVVGVAEEGFTGHAALFDVSVWVPVTVSGSLKDIDMTSRRATWLETIGRLAPGASITQARTGLNLIAQRLAQSFPDDRLDEKIDVRPYAPVFAQAAGPASAFALLLFVVSGIILLIASVNVGGMLLSRGSQRAREMAMRLAVGAGRLRLVRQLLTESVLLFVMGGAGGVALAWYVTSALNAVPLPIPAPLIYDFSPDGRALLFALLLALVTGVVFGLAPALHAIKPDLASVLRDGAGAGQRRSRLRSAFVVAQVAGTALLLIGAGLLARGLANADAVDVGMNPSGVQAVAIDLSVHNYGEEEAEAFFRTLYERLGSVPGITSYAMIDMLPLSMSNQTSVYFIEGRDPAPDVGRFRTDLARLTPGYFETLEIPIVAGRGFRDTDREGAPMVVIVNETVARRTWPGEDAVGKVIQFGSFRDPTALEVIGVARDARYRNLGDEGRNMLYVPLEQWPADDMTVVARTGGVAGIPAALDDAVRALDPDLPIVMNVPYPEVIGLALLPNRAAAVLSGVFGGLGLLLAAIGLYGLLAYSVTIRTREIGIRIALGAEAARVRALVLRDGIRLVVAGLTLGLVIAASVTRLLGGLLMGVDPLDPVTFAAIATILVAVAAGASSLPARRATRTNPVDALRSE